jgi:stage II sporulation protein D
VVDSFATQGKGYSWKVLIPAVEWQAYLTKKGMKSADGKLHKQLLVKQDKRISSYKVGNDSIRLATVMADWGWKSSFFTMTLDNGVITVKGNGSGHGVGVSQESAILMSQKGYKYDYMLKYFYKDIRIININELNVFAEMQTKETKERP